MLAKMRIADVSIGEHYRRASDKSAIWRKIDDRQHETIEYDSIAEQWQFGYPCITEYFNPNEIVLVSR
jgi:hypothetical protein